ARVRAGDAPHPGRGRPRVGREVRRLHRGHLHRPAPAGPQDEGAAADRGGGGPARGRRSDPRPRPGGAPGGGDAARDPRGPRGGDHADGRPRVPSRHPGVGGRDRIRGDGVMGLADSGVLTGRAAIITGAATGIGRASALLFARAGARVALVDVREPELARTEADVRAAGGEVAAIAADLGNPDDCAAVVGRAVRAFGRLDVVLNNAGVGTMVVGGTVESISLEHWDLAQDVNVRAIYLVSRAAVPHMRGAGGAIVNIASVSAFRGPAERPRPASAAPTAAGLALPRLVHFGRRHRRRRRRDGGRGLVTWGAPRWPPKPPQSSERPGGAVALLYRGGNYGAPRWPPNPPKRSERPGGAVALLYRGGNYGAPRWPPKPPNPPQPPQRSERPRGAGAPLYRRREYAVPRWPPHPGVCGRLARGASARRGRGRGG